ncbi:MAG: bifunctional 4-hydroxy-2-oxoglutarate aldolase/2-dehydro-3-deoxy-phosphogluconate aldolase [Acidobacteriales bacterium]|nr:bifunctional 4-hydroxy-2-oxoglutarate aldolase/2-dehydro-3-deoxy-phosphogluconate aldolase [Terriglobales bacterium]
MVNSHRSKADILGQIRQTGLLPVVRVTSREHALCAAEGVVRAGIPLIEITLTIPGAIETIKELTERYGSKLIVGAGTVLDAGLCHAAIQNGAEFIVSPSLELPVLAAAKEHEVVCISGALTPTEAMAAWRAGADLVKIFPCGSVGGAKYIRALKGPFPQIDFVATSGVDIHNAAEFIASGTIAVGVGEKIFDPIALQEGDADRVCSNAVRFVTALQPALRHG